MRRKYKFVRLPEETYQRYANTKAKMENDLRNFTGKKNLTMTMPKVFEAFVNPKVNKSYVEIDLRDLHQLAKTKRGRQF